MYLFKEQNVFFFQLQNLKKILFSIHLSLHQRALDFLRLPGIMGHPQGHAY